MRIRADENVPGPVIQALRDRGHDVVAVKETMRGVSDPVILDHAKAEARLVVTFARTSLNWVLGSNLSVQSGGAGLT